ncbi:MAG TPA: hypothetical protein DDW62_01195 [Marinilabiliaceae bacterium]|nr:hypothetical protein [Marinilabiliaceae bacterium]
MNLCDERSIILFESGYLSISVGFKLRKANKQDKTAPGGLEQEHEASPEIIKSMESCLTK